MQCPLCSNLTKIKPDKKNQIIEHLIITMDKNNHLHVHGPVKNQQLMLMFIQAIAEQSGIDIESE